MAVAVGASAYADHQRHKAIERITDLLEQLHDDKLEQERNQPDGCRDAIDKATSVLLDQGKIGQSLGLDSASHEISTAIAAARTRLKKVAGRARRTPRGAGGADGTDGGIPRYHGREQFLQRALGDREVGHCLEAQAASWCCRRSSHAQLDGTVNPFKSFLSELRSDEQRLNDLESNIDGVLMRLSSLELKRPSGLLKKVHYAPSDVDKLLTAAYPDSRLSATVSTRLGAMLTL